MARSVCWLSVPSVGSTALTVLVLQAVQKAIQHEFTKIKAQTDRMRIGTASSPLASTLPCCSFSL